MIEWLDDFYGDPDMRSTMLRNFLPLFTSYVTEATGGPVAASFVQALAESYVDRHLGSSRAQLQEVVKGSDDPLAALTARFDEWEEKRPEKVARNELVRSANAASVEKMREAGVTKMVWRASGGKTCPFCTELDGTIISVTGTFFEAGDTLNPAGATAPINFESSLGHPPVHQGCVCSVEAVTETDRQASEAEGFQQTLGLFPEPEQPLLSSAERYKYFGTDLRPEDADVGEAWERTVDIHRTVRDDLVDRDSFWTGVVNRTAPGDWGDTAEWDGSISFDFNVMRGPSERFHLMLHESLHHFSAEALDQSRFLGYRGWEEGLVEQLTRLYRDKVAGSLGMELDGVALKAWETQTNYNRYITQLEKVRRGLGSDKLGFYEALHAIPTNERLDFVKSAAREKLASGEWTQDTLNGFLDTVDKAHRVLQV